ncbi:MAG: PD-(D/E)XK nuclease family protein [Pirellulaceae bacterium]|nr:PD-(D/E)XK nuclease family protein [Pirellulaceae bacterium]
MPLQRHFLDWTEPALSTAARWLAERYARATTFDLGNVIVVVPGSRSRGRLLELLVAAADSAGQTLTPPRIITEKDLPELLYPQKKPFASELTQQLAWTEALRATPAATLGHFVPHPPDDGDTARWLELGDLLRELHVELAADGLDFESVLACGDRVEGFAEHDRWQTLADVQRRYHARLDGLGLWDKQTARLVAIKNREPQTDRDIVLLGMVDLNQAQRQLLDLVAERVAALVFAPPALVDRFDPHGCLLAAQWLEAELPLRDEQIERVDGPADQAAAVTAWLDRLGGQYRADQIVIGTPDQRLAPQLGRQLAQSGVPSRSLEGRTLAESGPYRLLALLAAAGPEPRFADLAALVRHPDLFDWLQNRPEIAALAGSDPLAALDQFAAEQVPATIDPERLKKNAELALVAAIWDAVGTLRALLPAEPLPLAEWGSRFRELLLAVYGQRELDRNIPAQRLLIEAFERIEAPLLPLAEIPAELMPRVSAREAFELILAPQKREPLPPPAAADVVEILGWLELPLDDAPALLVTTFNEGFVPTSTGGDPFLPNRLRAELGLLHNDRRYARDAYALALLVHSRAELKLLVARRDVEGNPLAPSRLLFAADEETVARRALSLFGDLPPTPPRRNLLAASPPLLASTLAVPRPDPAREPPTKMSVTAFKAYLACPYRYYLSHVLGLAAISDGADELDPAAFGNLLHDVLEQFGRKPEAADARATGDPERIFEFLGDQLSAIAGARFGKHCRPAVRVQIEQGRLRLRAFADWQARRNREGWRIVHSEDSERRLGVDFAVDGEPIRLEGRIDRIDYHDATRTLSILDYKTADAGLKPQVTHVKAGQWIDLQLPLYRHLIDGAKLPGLSVTAGLLELGYILLPKDVRGVGAAMASWTGAELAAADEQAREVVRNLRQRIFWPPKVPPPPFAEDLAAICHDHRLGSWRPTEGDAA